MTKAVIPRSGRAELRCPPSRAGVRLFRVLEHRELTPFANRHGLLLRHATDELAEVYALFQAAGPSQLPFPNRHVRAAVAHVLSPVGENLDGRDDHDRLEMETTEQETRRAQDARQGLADAGVERPEP